MKKMTITEFAETLGVIPDTVRRWERDGKIQPERTRGGHRRYSEKDIENVMESSKYTTNRRAIAYCRVSSEERTAELGKQIEAMEFFALGRGLSVEIISEVGNGLDMTRPKFVSLLSDIVSGEVSTVIVAHKDRLARFGFELIEIMAKRHNCEVVVAGSEKHSPRYELVNDFKAMVSSFSMHVEDLHEHEYGVVQELEAS
ncbi:MAG: IS607 family transposase [Oscillospiraceae bacterium]|nr:IS607 family transposase [Oscillospiraceae bacterium]